MHQPSHLSPVPHFKQITPSNTPNPMKSQALNSMTSTNFSNASSEKEKTIKNYRPLDQLASMESQYLKIEIDLEDISDSYFSRSEMAAAEQLVQLSDHSDYYDSTTSTDFCNRGIGNEKDFDDEEEGEERNEISSSCSAIRMKIEEIFGRADKNDDVHCDEREDNQRPRKRPKKYASLSQIYKMTTPLIGYRPQYKYRSEDQSMIKKVKYS